METEQPSSYNHDTTGKKSLVTICSDKLCVNKNSSQQKNTSNLKRGLAFNLHITFLTFHGKSKFKIC